MKHKNNKVVITIIGVLAFILFAAGVFYGTYYFIMNKSTDSYEKAVKVVINQVDVVNDSISSLFKGQAIDPLKIRTEMSRKIDALLKQKEALKDVTVSDKYKKDHENLNNGLDKNILIFRQVDAIVKNPDGNDIDKAGDNLKKYRDEALESYSLVNIKSIKIGLTANALKLVDYTSNYVNEMVKLNRDKEISQNQNQEFIDSLDILLSRFTPINVDLASKISKIRNEKGNMDNVIALAEKNRDHLDLIQQEFSNLTVPSKAVNCYKLFTNILDNFDSYFQSFVYSANNEKLSGSDLSSEKIKELYAEPTAKFNEISKDYTDFLKAYSEFKQWNVSQ